MTTRRIGRQAIDLSNLDKVLFPGEGITKKALVDYYEAIAPSMLPHIRQRALVMHRHPDGIDREGFYQKQVPEHFPKWIRRVAVETSKGPQEQVVCHTAATLVYLANQGVMTPHPWLSRVDRLDHPDLLIFDVDPPGDDFDAARWAALHVRQLIESLGATTFVRTTGSRGLHVVVPLDRTATFKEVRAVASSMMKWLAGRHPKELTTEQRLAKRGRRVYLDVGRNAYGQTAVASYAVRARPGAPVSTPVEWKDVEEGRVTARSFTIETILKRVARREDPWAEMRRHALPVRRLADGLRELTATQGGKADGRVARRGAPR